MRGPRRHEKLVRMLMEWYAQNRRELPFRRTRDPYAIWVSEVMLQQTQVSTVVPYFERWMRALPDVPTLAQAREEDVLALWQGLGYYSRARRLQAAARAIVERHGGVLPTNREALRSLPGIGDYSAGAIASIAYGLREPLVDGNVVRVLCRHFGLYGDPTRAPLKAALWKLAAELVPETRPGDFNQGVMELGATVCTPRAPRCEACPWRASCVALRQGAVSVLPELPPRREATKVSAVAAVVRCRGALLLSRLPSHAPRWGGMWVLPTAELGMNESAERAVARAARELASCKVSVHERIATLSHTITRFRITLEAFACRTRSSSVGASAAWKAPSELDALAIPTPHRRLLAKVLDS